MGQLQLNLSISSPLLADQQLFGHGLSAGIASAKPDQLIPKNLHHRSFRSFHIHFPTHTHHFKFRMFRHDSWFTNPRMFIGWWGVKMPWEDGAPPNQEILKINSH
jgi:hypothetical protein